MIDRFILTDTNISNNIYITVNGKRFFNIQTFGNLNKHLIYKALFSVYILYEF